MGNHVEGPIGAAAPARPARRRSSPSWRHGGPQRPRPNARSGALWKTPQATQWEKRGWLREVALYARHQAKAEAGSLDDAKEARQREDRLGLNDMAMLRLRWEIVDDAAAKRQPAPRSKRGSSRYRDLRVVS